ATSDFVTQHARFSWDSTLLLERSLALIQPFFENRPGDWVYLEDLSGRMNVRLQQLAAEGLEWGVCHGDFSGKNIHVTHERELGVFDFDWCGSGWLARDYCKAYQSAVDKGNPASWPAFVNGYREIRAVKEIDLQAVPLFLGLSHVWMLGNFAQWVNEWGTSLLDGTTFNLGALRKWEHRHFDARVLACG